MKSLRRNLQTNQMFTLSHVEPSRTFLKVCRSQEVQQTHQNLRSGTRLFRWELEVM